MPTPFPQHVVDEQYKTAANLGARVQLHQRFGSNPVPWFTWVLDHCQLHGAARILEVGGGHGLLWQENRARLPADWRITLTDRSPGMVAQAAATLGDLPHFAFARADAQTLPFADAAFDLVIANHMLYHVPDRAAALTEMHRVLRSGGRLLVATNDRNHMGELRDLARRYSPVAAYALPSNERFPFDVAQRELGAVFAQVTLHRYANQLRVDDADALADYMLSGLPMNLRRLRAAHFRRWLRDEMQTLGSVVITPLTGLLEATKAATRG